MLKTVISRLAYQAVNRVKYQGSKQAAGGWFTDLEGE
jgi:hypothetical protein